MRIAVLPFALLLLLPAAVAAQTTPPLTLEQVMADPDWIGPPVEQAWWSWDGKQVQYQLKREGATIKDTWRQPVDGGPAQKVDGAARAELDAANPVFDAARTRMAFVRNGDVFVRDLRSGALTQVTRTDAAEALPQWSRDGNLVFRVGNDWFRWRAGAGVSQAAVVKAEKDPAAAPKPDDLRERQMHMIRTLQDDKARRDAARVQDEQWRRDDATRTPLPAYLGNDVAIVDSLLSPDARWLLVVTTAKDADAGQAGKMPKYVTESGYEEFEEVRTRVGRNASLPQRAWLVDVNAAKVSELKFDTLPGIKDDPLAALRKAAKQDALKGNRTVQVLTSGDNSGAPSIRWSDDGHSVAMMVRAIDNKDRWIASVDLATAKLQPRHRLTDPAWINWGFNDFGWTPDGQLWLLSEQSGYSHIYLSDGGTPRALTSGKWEASAPQLSPDGSTFYFLCNRKWPGDYEVCAADRKGGAVRELTDLGGVEDFALSPDGTQLLVRHSRAYMPAQVSVVAANGGEVRQLTDTRKDAFKSRDWMQPEYVQVPSKHGAGTVWGKYYGPRQPEAGKKYPIVMFVHGAGYLQNVDDRWPEYFREQMFHNLLVEHGYVVLDLDYRGSEGYGRDWRTAIYRNMGHPELEDYLDGLDWLVANKQGDKDRAGIYGGSYGGFMTFMALFRSPGTFKAGAALRPVSDWSQYNHEYTSNILNTPELDPEAYRVSSPIEYADKLQDHLLIAHGMIDDNVFFKDSVMLSQRLIELHKDKWEIAPYPMERHTFAHPDAWYDEYRRIYELFERTLK
ncbi:dipeptidyl aminopeptidase/acylaminoacyl peptidase [Lysobacter niabensis]|uniref:Dipeptidyl aminopeptidase/acylaminoacyl peptidase n=1 Tax=Agrilutibacter niabensis TaxID=380628 RepID=A0ABU1VRK9_9GAMM|nr:prolyl oligopeptidase family serine peptidase [Lysobacter niabensis]MDR7099990.1 dipeptidyl aminopeptidase/acylaminoacyl peptidase [Lysobacter niabensis]